jgi:DNA (cytosine-5)-methyltransferase 1
VNENPTHLDLFSGIGGFALAAGWAGFETVGFCDNEPYAQAVLKKHWPNVPIYGDIKTLDGTAYRGVTLLTGGFPCQPFSCAGKQRGKDDDRYLWPQMLRVIQEARPAWIVGENVAGIIGLALDQVCSDLEACGYEVEPIIIPACGVDAPHRRDRVWIVGNAKFNGHFAGESGGGLLHKSKKQTREIEERESSGASCSSKNVADTNGGQFSKCEPKGQQIQMLGESGERVRGVRWLAEPGVGRLANGIPNRVAKLKGLGNAIVPQLAYQIIIGIRELL